MKNTFKFHSIPPKSITIIKYLIPISILIPKPNTFNYLKSSKSVLLHWGHFGLVVSDTITYIRHRGQPTTIMGTSPAAPPAALVSSAAGLNSRDTHDHDGDRSTEEEEGDRRGGGEGGGVGAVVPGGDRLSFKSSSGVGSSSTWLIFLCCGDECLDIVRSTMLNTSLLFEDDNVSVF